MSMLSVVLIALVAFALGMLFKDIIMKGLGKLFRAV